MSEELLSREQSAILALAHRAKPKRTLERMTETEVDALAAIWDEYGQSLGADFAAAFDEFWETHRVRYQEWLEAQKASDAVAEDEDEDEDES